MEGRKMMFGEIISLGGRVAARHKAPFRAYRTKKYEKKKKKDTIDAPRVAGSEAT
jgi:hypothetical protein